MKKRILSITLTFALILTTLIFTTMFNVSAENVKTFTFKSFVERDGYKMKGTAVYGNYLYVSSERGMLIFDVTAPEDPIDVTPVWDPADVVWGPNESQDDMIIHDGKLYAINWTWDDRGHEPKGVKVFDLTDPANPDFLEDEFYLSNTMLRGIEIYNGYLFIGTQGPNLDVYKLGDTENKLEIDMSVAEFSQNIVTSKFHNGYVYSISRDQSGSNEFNKYISVAKVLFGNEGEVNVSELSAYELNAKTVNGQNASALEIIGDTLYIGVPHSTDHSGTLCAIDITIPTAFLTNPDLVHYYKHSWADAAKGSILKQTNIFKAYDNYLFRGDLSGAITMYDMTDPTNFYPVFNTVAPDGWSVSGITVDKERELLIVTTYKSMFIMSYSDLSLTGIRYEAEFSDLTGCSVSGDGGGYSGTGSVYPFDNGGTSSISKSVYVPVAGIRTFKIKGILANHNIPAFAAVKVFVNSVEQKEISFLGDTGWVHTEREFSIDLAQGINNIELVPYKSDDPNSVSVSTGEFRIDCFEIGKNVVLGKADKPFQIYTMEGDSWYACTNLGLNQGDKDGFGTLNANVGSDQGNATSWQQGGAVTFTVNAERAGARELSLLYRAGENGWCAKFDLIVNGSSAPIDLESVKGSWEWSDGFQNDGINKNFKTEVYLQKGVNTIVLSYADVQGDNPKPGIQIAGMYLELTEPQNLVNAFEIANPVLIGANGAKITSIPAAGQLVNASLEIATQTAGTQNNCMFITAFFGAGNKLLDLSTVSGVYGEKEGILKLSTPVQVPAGALKWSVFLWDGSQNMKPIKTFEPIE